MEDNLINSKLRLKSETVRVESEEFIFDEAQSGYNPHLK